MKIAGKTVAVTGGAGGIGSHIVKHIIEEGGTPLVIDRVPPVRISPQNYLAGDLSSFDGIAAVASELARRRPDILVNLAGIQYFGLFDRQEPEALERMYRVNLIAPVLLAQAVLPFMRVRKSGQIVNIGSIFGSIAFAHFVTYSSAKAGVKAFSEALRREVAEDGITVTYIAPRAVKTPLNNDKILKLAARTKMAMDAPEHVAARIMAAIRNDEKDVYLGFPEGLFVRVNALLPRMVDGALARNDRIAKEILTTA